MKAPPEIHRFDLERPLGHDDALAAIESLIFAAATDNEQPLPHALIIAGPAGVGKDSLFGPASERWLSNRLFREMARAEITRWLQA